MRGDWRYVDEEWDSIHGNAKSGAGEGKYSHISSTEEVEIPDVREIEGDKGEIGRWIYAAGGLWDKPMDITVIREGKGENRPSDRRRSSEVSDGFDEFEQCNSIPRSLEPRNADPCRYKGKCATVGRTLRRGRRIECT